MKLFGINPVVERLRANPHSIRKIHVQEGFSEAGYIYQKAKKWGIPVICLPRGQMIKFGRNLNTQGIIVEVDEFIYTPYSDLLDLAKTKRLTLVFLDELNDPQNLGAILRSLGCFGSFAVVIPTHDSVSITESVLRVASGGENYVPVAKVPNISQAIIKAKDADFTIAGTLASGGQSLDDIEFSFPLGLVMGSEQKGIRDVVRKHLDVAITIPVALERLSFNVAHATSIVCYEIAKQKKKKR
jgi:23S rRNA (guanosine2251-2'-O)-methyltransferase